MTFRSQHARSSVYLLRRLWATSKSNRERTDFQSFEFQWWPVNVHRSPAPTHPRSRGFLSQWKLLAPEWEAGFSSEKKKKDLTTPCFLYLATLGSISFSVWLFWTLTSKLSADSKNSRQINWCARSQAFTMAAKNTAATAGVCAVLCK